MIIPSRRQIDAAESRSYLLTVQPLIDATLMTLGTVQFLEDPIAGDRHSRNTSIVSSMFKRHGQLIEQFLFEALRTDERFVVWQESGFHVSRAAENVVMQQPSDECLKTNLPYGENHRVRQIDLFVFTKKTATLRSYEIKRGNGYLDAGKRRDVWNGLRLTQVLLASYGQQRGLDIKLAESKIIFYYGLRSIPEPWSLIGDELDQHFNASVQTKIELANSYFREQLMPLLEGI